MHILINYTWSYRYNRNLDLTQCTKGTLLSDYTDSFPYFPDKNFSTFNWQWQNIPILLYRQLLFKLEKVGVSNKRKQHMEHMYEELDKEKIAVSSSEKFSFRQMGA